MKDRISIEGRDPDFMDVSFEGSSVWSAIKIKLQKEALSRIVAARQRHRADLMTLALPWIRRFKCELQGRCDQRSGARR